MLTYLFGGLLAIWAVLAVVTIISLVRARRRAPRRLYRGSSPLSGTTYSGDSYIDSSWGSDCSSDSSSSDGCDGGSDD